MSMLSEYETVRARNIERNNARLRALGLISIQEEKQSNDIAWKRKGSQLLVPTTSDVATNLASGSRSRDSDEVYELSKYEHSIAKTREKRPSTSPSTTENRRRKSLRLQGGVAPDSASPSLEKNFDDDGGTTIEEEYNLRKRLVEECRAARQAAALAFYEKYGDQAAKDNPTASYEHCLMRVRTMTQKALANRVKMIERAAGKHCVIKMAVFKSCLQDEGLWDLAKLAADALERLKALQAPPEEDETIPK